MELMHIEKMVKIPIWRQQINIRNEMPDGIVKPSHNSITISTYNIAHVVEIVYA